MQAGRNGYDKLVPTTDTRLRRHKNIESTIENPVSSRGSGPNNKHVPAPASNEAIQEQNLKAEEAQQELENGAAALGRDIFAAALDNELSDWANELAKGMQNSPSQAQEPACSTPPSTVFHAQPGRTPIPVPQKTKITFIESDIITLDREKAKKEKDVKSTGGAQGNINMAAMLNQAENGLIADAEKARQSEETRRLVATAGLLGREEFFGANESVKLTHKPL